MIKTKFLRIFGFTVLLSCFNFFGLGANLVLAATGNAAQFVGQSVSATMDPNRDYPVSVTMKNTGSTVWTENLGYRLGVQNPQDNGNWLTGRVNLAAGESIAPGQSKTFSFNVTPRFPGKYNFQWRMVQDSVEWFGDYTQNILISVPLPKSPLMERIKARGCVWEGFLSGFGDVDVLAPLLSRSGCEYAHRALETWPYPPDFEKAKSIMARVSKSGVIYGMESMEGINTSATYYYADENRNFNFASMCKPGTNTSTTWGVMCTPTLTSSEFQKYLLYIARKAIDIGIQDISFAQPYLYDNFSSPVMPTIIYQIRQYAQSKGKLIVIGGQDLASQDENYLRQFDYDWGGVAQDTNGNIEDAACSVKWPGGCWPLLWHPTWAVKNNDVLLHLDWYGNTNDDNAKFIKFSSDLRAKFLSEKYVFFRSKGMGFLIPYFVPNTAGTSGCAGSNANYTPDKNGPCKDEDAINQIFGVVCAPDSVSGCKICKADGTAWVDTDSKCASGQKCQSGNCVAGCTASCSVVGAKQCSGNGVQACALDGDCLKWGSTVACASGQSCSNGECKTNCVPKTCAALGFPCGNQSDGCGGTLTCGTCVLGKSCSNGSCVSDCTSHKTKRCDDGNLYWYNSCGAKEELAQNCGIDETTSNLQCSGNWTQKETVKKGCGNASCTSLSSWVNDIDCGLVGKKCQAGFCAVDSSKSDNSSISNGGDGGVLTDSKAVSTTNASSVSNVTTQLGATASNPVAKMTRAEVSAKINEIVALIAKLQEQLKAMSGSVAKYSCTQITKNLFYGIKNDTQVKCLQEALRAQGYAVVVSGSYDASTKTAVAQFQQEYAKEILVPFGLTRGSGNVGNTTKNRLNQIISGK